MARTNRLPLAAGQHLLVGLALIGFLVGTIGVPLPRVIFRGKDRSQPFPCMDRACGCQSAAQCWAGCCCFTNRQKIVWAREHNVEVPAFVARWAQREETSLHSRRTSCGEHETPCCDEPTAKCCESDNSEASEPIGIVLVLAIEARRCQGQAELWITLGAAAPLPERASIEADILPCGTAAIAPHFLAGQSPVPPTPPPIA